MSTNPEEAHNHRWQYFVLAPNMEAEKNAKFMKICLDCTLVEYLKEVPEDADFSVLPASGRISDEAGMFDVGVTAGR